ncbi:MAG: daptide biosynthesis RiPP recognition protein [Nakamurella sp.]
MFDAHLEAWFTGMMPDGIDRAEVVLVATADSPPDAAAIIEQSIMISPTDGFETDADSLFDSHRRSVRVLRQVAPAMSPGSCDEFSGALRPGEELYFGDGLGVRIRNYGVADFESLDVPTAFIISDDDDFSAYLRDADTAWNSGAFAPYVTHQSALIANLACLGGAGDAAGPLNRLYVDDDGIARTSPVGRGLGALEDGLQALHRRWQRGNAVSVWPDTVGLEDVVSDGDRVAAFSERPWIGRYVSALRALRVARATGRVAQQVSGFSARLTPGLPLSEAPDRVDAPVLARFGAIYRALDPVGRAQIGLDPGQLRALELVLGGADMAEVPDAGAACQWLLAHNVARSWCLAVREATAASLA